MCGNPEQRCGRNSVLHDAMSMEEHGLALLGSMEKDSHSYRSFAMLVLISNRLKEVTERLMEVEKVLKETH